LKVVYVLFFIDIGVEISLSYSQNHSCGAAYKAAIAPNENVRPTK